MRGFFRLNANIFCCHERKAYHHWHISRVRWYWTKEKPKVVFRILLDMLDWKVADKRVCELFYDFPGNEISTVSPQAALSSQHLKKKVIVHMIYVKFKMVLTIFIEMHSIILLNRDSIVKTCIIFSTCFFCP